MWRVRNSLILLHRWSLKNFYVGILILDSTFWPNHSLREKCPNTELFLVRVFLYSDWIGISLRIQFEYSKIRTRNNSVFGHFFTQWLNRSWWWTIEFSVGRWKCPAGNYMFKVKNGNSRTRCKIFLKLTIKTPERR